MLRLDYDPLVVTTSTLTPDGKKNLRQQLVMLGGHLVNSWQDTVTHVTMCNLTLTVKVGKLTVLELDKHQLQINILCSHAMLFLLVLHFFLGQWDSLVKDKSKVVCAHRENRGVSPLTLNPGTRWKWVVNIMPWPLSP